jgi:lipopolysaccharide transport system ATP-binding protein
MAVKFIDLTSPPLRGFSATAPDGAVIGILGDEGAGGRELLRAAAGLTPPASGSVEAPASRRLIGPGGALDFDGDGVVLLDHALAMRDAFTLAQASMELLRLRRRGGVALLLSHDERLLGEVADEIWWLESGTLRARGDAREVLAAYREHVAGRLRVAGQGARVELAPPLRRGDGRATLVSIDTLDAGGQPAMTWQSGEPASVAVTIRYNAAVADPVAGIMIRTRIGFEVYGTNTELEGVRLGPCAAGQTLRVVFSFRCDLAPREYTLTAASHDPDGTLHEWLEDAVAFAVADSRFTAGVANLRAQVRVERL